MSAAPDLIRFSVFELDRRSGELRKSGRRVALQDHSFRVLVRLLERPGELVTREELCGLLWPGDTFVDFERGLNTAVKRLRDALDDVAVTPRFIETLPRRGYRFIAPVDGRLPTGENRATAESPPPSRRASFVTAPPLIAAAIILTTAAFVIAVRRQAAHNGNAPVAHLIATVRPADQLSTAEVLDRVPTIGFGRPSRTAIAISPDGEQLVFSARRGDSQMLYRRPLDQPEAEPLAGTDGADSPFFSPDGKWIGFWADGMIRKVPVEGGPVVTVTNLAPPPRAASVHGSTDPPLFGASWGSDDVIVFSLARGGLWEVPASGGTPTPLTRLQPNEAWHRLPHVLPGARTVLFTAGTQKFGDWEQTTIESYDRASGTRKLVIERGADPRYLPTGHLLYVRSGTLLAVPFDAVRLELLGDPVGMIADVMQAAYGGNARIDTGAAQFGVSNTGTLVYVPGGRYPKASGRLVWVDRRGRIEPLGMGGDLIAEMPRLSPDGRRVAFGGCQAPACGDIWAYDLARRRLSRLTFGAGARSAVWTHDGRRITFASDRHGPWGIFSTPADGSALTEPERLAQIDGDLVPAGWSAAGDALVFARRGAGHWDIWTLVREKDRTEVRAFVATPFDEINPALSPDGRWLAYVSTESGRAEVYLQPFPGPGPKRQISTGGGDDPIWRRDGRELFFIAGLTGEPKKMMAASIRTEPEVAVGSAVMLFEMVTDGTRVLQRTAPVVGHDVAADGRFLMVRMDEPPPPRPATQIHLVLNWHAELGAKARRGRAVQ